MTKKKGRNNRSGYQNRAPRMPVNSGNAGAIKKAVQPEETDGLNEITVIPEEKAAENQNETREAAGAVKAGAASAGRTAGSGSAGATRATAGKPAANNAAPTAETLLNDKSTSLHIDFIGKRKIYYAISITLILAGIIVSSVLGLKLDIQFKGGAIVQYSFKGNASLIDKNYIQSVATKDFNSVVSVSLDTGGTSTRNYILVNMNRQITPAQVTLLDNQLTSKFTNSDIAYSQTTDVDPDMGRAFFQSSIFEVLLAAALIIIYIWFRFRKIGGLPAGITAFIALVHDVTMAFVVFSVFRIPINENFIAVALLILGYSINDTIVVYDRIRENRVKFGNKVHFKDIVNRSINQSFVRSVNTTLVTFVAITVVLIFSIIFKIDTIFSFALPMMVGVVTGCYSTICIAGPLWVTWVTYKEKKISPKGAAKKLTPKKV